MVRDYAEAGGLPSDGIGRNSANYGTRYKKGNCQLDELELGSIINQRVDR